MDPNDLITTIESMTPAQLDRLQNAINAVRVEVPKPAPMQKIGALIGNSVVPLPVVSTPYIIYSSVNEGFLAQDFGDTIEIAAERIFNAYPDRLIRETLILQASPERGKKFSENPAHGDDGFYVDIAYFQTGKGSAYSLWEGFDSRFDVPRNRDFLLMIHKVFPACQVTVDKRIKAAMGLTGREYEWVWPDDISSGMGHEWHMHIWRGRKGPNLEATL